MDGGLRELPEARLAGLRAQAETYLIAAYERFRAGQKMLAAREDRAQTICAAIREEWERSLRAPIVPGTTGRGRPRVSARYLNDCTADEAFGNFLVFVDRELGGFLPALNTYRRFYYRFVRRDFGGQANVEAHLAADSLTLVAALVIILTDCTWNVATGLGLRVGCIRKSTRPGHFEIHSFKARADKPQIATLPNKALGPSRLTVRDVVGMVLEMTVGRGRSPSRTSAISS